jgi:ribulose kinase
MPPKMLWFKQHEPALYRQMDYLLEFTDWIAYRLTGRFTLNLDTIAQRWFYHTPTGGWPHSLFAALDLEDLPARFPPSIHRVGEIVGELLPAVAAELGLPAGLPVAACGGDAFIGLLGQGVSAPGDVGVIMGSSNVMSALSREELHFPGILGSFPDAVVPGLNLVEAGQVSTGSILSWFKRNFGHGAAADAAAQGLSVYQLLDREAGQAPIGSGGLIVLDYFQGNRTPHTDSAARGMIWGLSLQADRGHIFRALMEGIAYGLQDIVLTLARHKFELGRMIASGGATQSSLFMQIYADVLGKTIAVTREPEASLLGSAIVAAVGAKAYPDLPTAAQAMVQVSHEYCPDLARHEEYQFFVRMYQETYQQMKGLMHNMERRIIH